MSGRDWGISIALGVMSIPIGFLIRMIPNRPCERFLIRCKILPDPSRLPTVHPQAELERWDDAIEIVRDNLTTFANLRGGRVRASSFVGKSRRTTLSQAGIQLCVPMIYCLWTYPYKGLYLQAVVTYHGTDTGSYYHWCRMGATEG